MIMKKTLRIICVFLVCFCMLFMGCTNNEVTQPQSTPAPASETAAQETAAQSAAPQSDPILVNQVTLANELQDKYSESSKYEYAEPINNVKRDTALRVNIGFDPLNIGMSEYTEIVQLFQDAQLTQDISTAFDWNDQTGEIVMTPLSSPVLGISTIGLEGQGNALRLFDKGEQNDWGNLGKIYMVEYVDMQTGEKLEKPLVKVLNFRGEIKRAPKIKFEQTEDGRAAFSWDKVSNAEKYYVVKAEYSEEDGYIGDAIVIGETTDTYWESEKVGELINQDFYTFAVSEDEWLDESMADFYKEQGYTQQDIPVKRDDLYKTHFGVIAVSEKGTSMISNMYDKDELAALLPYAIAINKGDEKVSNFAKNILAAPSHRWIVMGDGITSQRIINYDFTKVEQAQEKWSYYEKEDMSDLTVKTIDVLKIPYNVEGTPFSDTMIIETYNKDTMEADLLALQERQESLRGKTGNVEIKVEMEEDEEEVEPEETQAPVNEATKSPAPTQTPSGVLNEEEIQKIMKEALTEEEIQKLIDGDFTQEEYEKMAEKLQKAVEAAMEGTSPEATQSPVPTSEASATPTATQAPTQEPSMQPSSEPTQAPQITQEVNTNYEVTANSALGEYLAYNLLDGVEIIDLSAFNESSDVDYLMDCFFEALYQNPLALGVGQIMLSNDKKSMLIVYKEDNETRKTKQEEIKAEVTKVVGEIIKPDMTDLEKEMAINNYLCESAQYDFEALDNAAKYNYEKTDPEFEDSFTPYGILVKKVGVCASYASSFKLLADAAGLESVVVTGYLDGSLAHAWNKTKIDGGWNTIDVTNNDNDVLYNSLVNLPDYASGKVLVEDNRYMVDDFLSNYEGTTTELEYYRQQGKYFNTDEIATALAEELKKSDQVVLRTDYDINDMQFSEIGQKVAEITGIEQLKGCYWMGVIALAK